MINCYDHNNNKRRQDMGPQFFQTGMGKTFFEGTMPRIARSLATIATELKRQNDLTEGERDKSPSEIADEFRTDKKED